MLLAQPAKLKIIHYILQSLFDSFHEMHKRSQNMWIIKIHVSLWRG